MPTIIEIEKMLGRKEPVTHDEWVQILECVTDTIRPILKNTTLERLCDIRLGHPSYLVEREKFFSNQEEADKSISFDSACERGITTEGIFFTDEGTKNAMPNVAFVLGLTRNGRWVHGAIHWLTTRESNFDQVVIFGKKVLQLWVEETSPVEISRKGDFSIPDVVDTLFTVLNGIIMRRNMQLTDLKNVSKQIGNIILTARYIPKELPRT